MAGKSTAWQRPFWQLSVCLPIRNRQNSGVGRILVKRGLVPAVATVLPGACDCFCRAHYLKNLADPLAEIDSAFNVGLRRAIRRQVEPLNWGQETHPGAPTRFVDGDRSTAINPSSTAEPESPSAKPSVAPASDALPAAPVVAASHLDSRQGANVASGH